MWRWALLLCGLTAAMPGQQAQLIEELEAENTRLKRLVADQALDIVMLKDVNSKKW